MLKSSKPQHLTHALGTSRKPLMNTSAPSWLHNVLTYGEKVIEY